MKKIADDIKNNSFNSLYLLYGEEKYILKLYLNKLLKALDAVDDSMNFTRFEGKQTAEKDIIEIGDTLPFFADRRVILIENSGYFKEKCERLPEYLKSIPEYLTIIFSEEEIDKRGRLYKAAAKQGCVCEFKTLSEAELSKMVAAELARSKKKIRKSTVEMFLSGAGTDFGFIACELEKLIAYSAEREEITEDDIAKICSPKIENRVFDMISDLAAGKKESAIRIYQDLILLKEPPMKMLALMERQYRIMLDMRQLLSKGMGENLIAETMGIHPYAVKKNMAIVRKYSEGELRGLLERIVGFDEDVKSGRISDRLAVEFALIG